MPSTVRKLLVALRRPRALKIRAFQSDADLLGDGEGGVTREGINGAPAGARFVPVVPPPDDDLYASFAGGVQSYLRAYGVEVVVRQRTSYFADPTVVNVVLHRVTDESDPDRELAALATAIELVAEQVGEDPATFRPVVLFARAGAGAGGGERPFRARFATAFPAVKGGDAPDWFVEGGAKGANHPALVHMRRVADECWVALTDDLRDDQRDIYEPASAMLPRTSPSGASFGPSAGQTGSGARPSVALLAGALAIAAAAAVFANA